MTPLSLTCRCWRSGPTGSATATGLSGRFFIAAPGSADPYPHTAPTTCRLVSALRDDQRGRVAEAVERFVTEHGETLETVTADHDGYLLAHSEGLVTYEGQPVASAAVRDDGELVVPRAGEGE